MVTVEVCVEGVGAARAAAEAGAERVELCCALALGGLTPSAAALGAAGRLERVEVVALLRPRPGDFLYAEEELAWLAEDLRHARAAGVAGLAFGCLTAQGEIDRTACARLAALAGPLPLTFHRAFDHVRDPLRALETLIELGFARVLTSGQAESAFAGRARLSEFVRAARGRIEVVAAGGVRPEHARELVAASGVEAVHFSASRPRASAMFHRSVGVHLASKSGAADELSVGETDAALVRAMVARLQTGSAG
jgi:copper homeostasis protein